MIPPGVCAALVTPLKDDGSLDRRAMRRLVAHVHSGGGVGVLVLGSVGEGATLPGRTRREVVETALEHSAVPVVAAVSGSSPDDVSAEAATFARLGCGAVLAPPPVTGPVDDRRTEAFYRLVADSIDGRLLAYHVPHLTGAPVPPEVVGRLAADGVLAGLKDSGRDLEYLQAVRARISDVPDFVLLTGVDSLLVPSLSLGARGAITAGTGIAPSLTSAAHQASSTGDVASAWRLQRRLTRLTQVLRTGTFPAGFKVAAELLALAGSRPAPSGPPASSEERARIHDGLRGLGLLPDPEGRVASDEEDGQ